MRIRGGSTCAALSATARRHLPLNLLHLLVHRVCVFTPVRVENLIALLVRELRHLLREPFPDLRHAAVDIGESVFARQLRGVEHAAGFLHHVTIARQCGACAPDEVEPGPAFFTPMSIALQCRDSAPAAPRLPWPEPLRSLPTRIAPVLL